MNLPTFSHSLGTSITSNYESFAPSPLLSGVAVVVVGVPFVLRESCCTRSCAETAGVAKALFVFHSASMKHSADTRNCPPGNFCPTAATKVSERKKEKQMFERKLANAAVISEIDSNVPCKEPCSYSPTCLEM